jgi:hypothetical protein
MKTLLTKNIKLEKVRTKLSAFTGRMPHTAAES